MTADESALPASDIAAPVEHLQPVTVKERISAVDILRGFALLGILVINIEAFSLPSIVIFNPLAHGGATGLDLLIWKFDTLFCFEKMMALFSMLFGGGLILMTARAEQINPNFKGFYYRRLMWLLVFGLIHAYLLWWGDILVPYALCGLLLYPMRKKSPRALIIVGICFILFSAAIGIGGGSMMGYVRDSATEAQKKLDAGESISALEQSMLRSWTQVEESDMMGERAVASEIEAFQGDLSSVHQKRVQLSSMMHLQSIPFYIAWRILGLMFVGMGLMKCGFLKGELQLRTYVIWAIVGYIIGLSIVWYGMQTNIDNNFDLIHHLTTGAPLNAIGSVFVAIANASLVIIIYKLGWLTWLLKRLQAVGRMAFSNYIFHTLVFTTIFYAGLGFGLFAHFNRSTLIWFVIGMWVFQLYISPIWLKHFRYGPLEWGWRSLTYWKRQPMRVRAEEE
ncbi:MAG: DUF418 domain-containing protein [Candidatus Zixiibacteriota bacterium]